METEREKDILHRYFMFWIEKLSQKFFNDYLKIQLKHKILTILHTKYRLPSCQYTDL